MVKVGIGLIGLQNWFEGDFGKALEMIRIADKKGVDFVSITDHVVMGEHIENYPYGSFPMPLEFPWYEPISALSAVAVLTSRIRLTTGILIGPLRPAALLAKQIGTLDHLSHGRFDLGIGAGWQKEEYIASGLPFEGRFETMIEQIEAMKALWRDTPATFNGKSLAFEKIYCIPQAKSMQILFGVAPTERNVMRIAEHGDGWIPMEQRPEKLGPVIDRLRAAFKTRGRDEKSLVVRTVPKPVFKNDAPDFEATAEGVPALLKVGVNKLEYHPFIWCRGAQDFEGFIDKLVALREKVS